MRDFVRVLHYITKSLLSSTEIKFSGESFEIEIYNLYTILFAFMQRWLFF